MENYDLHQAAILGILSSIPTDALSPANLTVPNSSDTTPLHLIARHGGLELLPL